MPEYKKAPDAEVLFDDKNEHKAVIRNTKTKKYREVTKEEGAFIVKLFSDGYNYHSDDIVSSHLSEAQINELLESLEKDGFIIDTHKKYGTPNDN